MEWNNKTFRNFVLAMAGLILFAWCLSNGAAVASLLKTVVGMLTPFIAGLVIAFVLNVPMRALEQHPLRRLREKSPRAAAGARALSFVLTLVLVLGVAALVAGIVLPELSSTAMTLSAQMPAFFERLRTQLAALEARLPELESALGSLELDWSSITASVGEFLRSGATSLLGSTVSIATSVFSGVFNFFLGAIFASYLLFAKEHLGVQTRRVLYSWLPVERADRLLYVAALTGRTFTRYLTSQCLEALILGSMFFVSMSLLRLPYAMLVAVVVALTALIPMFGAYIGCAVGAFLIFVASPMQALWFILLFLVLQQIENNFIYPRVVGGSIGLPAMWVMVAVTLGGGIFGVAGMIVMVPAASVLYTLSRERVEHRLLARGVPPDRWAPHDPPPADKPAAR